jgi:hypothetical protein
MYFIRTTPRIIEYLYDRLGYQCRQCGIVPASASKSVLVKDTANSSKSGLHNTLQFGPSTVTNFTIIVTIIHCLPMPSPLLFLTFPR